MEPIEPGHRILACFRNDGPHECCGDWICCGGDSRLRGIPDVVIIELLPCKLDVVIERCSLQPANEQPCESGS